MFGRYSETMLLNQSTLNIDQERLDSAITEAEAYGSFGWMSIASVGATGIVFVAGILAVNWRMKKQPKDGSTNSTRLKKQPKDDSTDSIPQLELDILTP